MKISRNPGLVLIVGSQTADSHPVLATRVKRAHKLHGQRLICSDPREHRWRTERTSTSGRARHRPGVDFGYEPFHARHMATPSWSFWISGVNVWTSIARASSRSRWSTRPRPAMCRWRLWSRWPRNWLLQEASRSCGRWELPSTYALGWIDSHLEPASDYRQLHGEMRAALIRCAAITTCRERAISRGAECLSRLPERTDPEFARSSKRVGVLPASGARPG